MVCTSLAVPGDYATIQEAMDAADPGDTVVVAPGTYTDVNDVEIFEGYSVQAVVHLKPGVTPLGRPDAPETVVTQNSHARLSDCIFSENAADSTGGAVYLNHGGVMTLNQITVAGNAAGTRGGGFMLRQDAGLIAGDRHLTGNTAPSGPDGFLDDTDCD